ncbi:MAG: polyprenyl synthetase family protein [Candidatus Bathyarchaeia archaeon]
MRKLIRQMQRLLKEKGKTACEIAKEEIFRETFHYEPVREALHYFIGEFWCNFHHPALISLACEAVGGKAEGTESIGAALVLLTGAVDIHDDILDCSKVKESKPTVFGIFGQDIALIVGNILLIKGFQLLNRACEGLPKKQRKAIFDTVKDGFLKLGMGVAHEMNLKGRWDVAPEEYFEVIKSKAAIAEAAAKIGAILGGGSKSEIKSLAEYGRILGILATIRDDFIDIFEPDELRNRAKNECLPLPLLYAFKNLKARKRITNLLEKENLSEEDAFTIAEVVMKTKEVQKLRRFMKTLLHEGVKYVRIAKNKTISRHLVNTLTATLEDL